jgi:hypothetical protein
MELYKLRYIFTLCIYMLYIKYNNNTKNIDNDYGQFIIIDN